MESKEKITKLLLFIDEIEVDIDVLKANMNQQKGVWILGLFYGYSIIRYCIL